MKKWGLLLLVVLAIFSVTKNAEAANWILIGSDESSFTYIDLDSISDGPNGSKEAETKRLHEVPYGPTRHIPPKYIRGGSFKKRYFDNKTLCDLTDVVFYTDGTVYQESPMCNKIRRVGTNSISEKIWNHLYQ